MQREERAAATVRLRFRGILTATGAAGPLFLLGMVINQLVEDPTAAPAFGVDKANIDAILTLSPVIVAAVLMVGSPLAFLPNLIGAMAMTWLSRHNEGMHFAISWALAGGLLGGVAGLLISDVATPLAFTGICCALICRWGLRTIDDPT